MDEKVKGAYVLLFRMTEAERLKIGRLGAFDIRPGRYAYVGSAMNGLEARISRHLWGGEKKHWHIDHLAERAVGKMALVVRSEVDVECRLAEEVRRTSGTTIPIPDFGSSDCKCISHLFLLGEGGATELRRALYGYEPWRSGRRR